MFDLVCVILMGNSLIAIPVSNIVKENATSQAINVTLPNEQMKNKETLSLKSVNNSVSGEKGTLYWTSDYRTTTEYYPSNNNNELSGWEIALIVTGAILFCCCCGGDTAYKTGHWETVRVFVRD